MKRISSAALSELSRYGDVALRATVAAQQGCPPVKAWQISAAQVFPNSRSSQIKGCPKSAFLGLAEAGMLKGIAPGKYTRSVDNKRYALAALEILRSCSSPLPEAIRLWSLVMEHEGVEKAYNCQMDVVLALWSAQKFIIQIERE